METITRPAVDRHVGSEPFNQKKRSHWLERALGCLSCMGPAMFFYFPSAKDLPRVRVRGRGRKRNQRVRQRNPLSLVTPPFWFMGAPIVLRRLASHCGKVTATAGRC